MTSVLFLLGGLPALRCVVVHHKHAHQIYQGEEEEVLGRGGDRKASDVNLTTSEGHVVLCHVVCSAQLLAAVCIHAISVRLDVEASADRWWVETKTLATVNSRAGQNGDTNRI
jgi:hypothetical protein